MTNVDTSYWKRIMAFFEREMRAAQLPDSTRSMAARGKGIAIRAQVLNDRVAELEAENAWITINRRWADISGAK